MSDGRRMRSFQDEGTASQEKRGWEDWNLWKIVVPTGGSRKKYFRERKE